jgi:putative zinc finger protein
MQHLDEGTIHAWLDGALTADEAARVQQHASECAECAATVAEARGLVAGASRILSALDDVPAGAGGGRWAPGGGDAQIPLARRPPPPARRPLWSRPGVLAAAASVVLVAGTALIMSKSDRAGPAMADMAVDSSRVYGQVITEAAANTRGGPAPTASPTAPTAGNAGRDGRGAVAGARVTEPAASRRMAAAPANQAPGRAAPDTSFRPRSELRAESQVATTAAAPLADAAASRKAAAPTARLVPAAPPAPAPAVAAAGADAAPRQRAAARRLGEVRADAAQRTRTDTLYALRVDTVITPPPSLPTLRATERAQIVSGAATPVSGVVYFAGCYDVIQGGLPSAITLDTTRVAGGAGGERYVATAAGLNGSWAIKGNSGIQLSIAGAAVEARFEPASRALRGTARRGGTSEAFVARRCR